MTGIDIHSADGTRLALHDCGGVGDPVLLLHGLCGYADEWSSVIAWLTADHHVYALDARGHGASERRPGDVSRGAHVADVAAAVTVTGPTILVGQSLGGHTALLFASSYPRLVQSLILVEAGPNGPTTDTPGSIDRWLAGWPTPFPDVEGAAAFLGGGLVGPAWAAGLEQRADGWWPRFERDVMVDTIAAAIGPRWREWDAISSPTLVVRGANGYMDSDEYARMARHPDVTAVEVPGAGHDVHLDSPDAVRAAITDFLKTHRS